MSIAVSTTETEAHATYLAGLPRTGPELLRWANEQRHRGPHGVAAGWLLSRWGTALGFGSVVSIWNERQVQVIHKKAVMFMNDEPIEVVGGWEWIGPNEIQWWAEQNNNWHTLDESNELNVGS